MGRVGAVIPTEHNHEPNLLFTPLNQSMSLSPLLVYAPLWWRILSPYGGVFYGVYLFGYKRFNSELFIPGWV